MPETTTPSAQESSPSSTSSPSGQGTSTTSSPRGAVVQRLRGMSFDDGAATLTPREARASAPVQRSADDDLAGEEEGFEAESDEGDGADSDFTLDDLAGAGLVSIDETRINEVVNRLTISSGLCREALAGGARPELMSHPDDADSLAQSIDGAALELAASAYEVDDGQLACDEALARALEGGVERGAAAVDVLDAICLAANAPELQEIASALTQLGALGELKLSELVIKAKTGADMVDMVIEDFQQHQQLFESRLTEAKKDTVGLLLGPLERLGKAGEIIKKSWSVYQMSEPLMAAFKGNGPASMSPWDAAKMLKTYAMPAAEVGAEVLGEVAKTALVPLGVLIDTCELIVDTGLASTELAILQQKLTLLRKVEAEYGTAIRFYEAHQGPIDQALVIMRMLKGASVRAEALISDAEAQIETANATYGALYAPVAAAG